MVTTIKVAIKFDHEPPTECLDNYADCVLGVVDEYCNHKPRSFYIELPTDEQVAASRFLYTWVISVCDATAYPKELFDKLVGVPGGSLIRVDVIDHKFEERHNAAKGYYWTNEGSTWYHDSTRSYVDSYYKFHANGNTDYEIVHMPSYVDKFNPREQKKWQDAGSPTYMWRCTSCWDNWLKAETIDEAIEEFEEIYREQLWKSVEGYQKGLDRATTAFKQFDEYQRNKK